MSNLLVVGDWTPDRGATQRWGDVEVTGKATKWVFMDECYVQTTAGWQRWDEYKDRAIASEGLKAAP